MTAIADAPKITANAVKAILVSHFLWNGYHAMATEYNYADVFGVTKSGYSHEWEVKINKADLMGELKTIRAVLNAGLPVGDKYDKHMMYLRRVGWPLDYRYGPNRFSFAVPEELADCAIEGVNGTPYGVVVISWPCSNITGNRYAGKYVKAGLLHKDKVTDRFYMDFARKVSTESSNYLTRQYVAQ